MPFVYIKRYWFCTIGYFIKSESIGEVNELLEKLSKENAQIYRDFQNMILLDAFVYNKGLAPIFDNGASLFSNLTIGDFLEISSMIGLNNYARDKINSFYGIPFDILVKNICSKDMIKDLKKLNNFHLKSYDKYNLSDIRLETIEKFINQRVSELIDILNDK